MRSRGCAAAVALVVVPLLLLVLAGWLVAIGRGVNPIRHLEPVPDDVPPAAGAALPSVDVNGPGRTAQQFTDWSQPLSEETGISVQALNAYANATAIIDAATPGCHLRWTTLAGIGYVETRHGTYSGRVFGGGKLDADGVATPPIVGPALDGTRSFAEIKDTDRGEIDTDSTYDRAVGPMQFIPGSWALYGRDADGDGVKNPQQIDDAAISAATLLCASERDLATPEGWVSAVRAYNNSDDYVIKVRNAANAYAMGQPPA